MNKHAPVIALNKKIQALGAERQLQAAISTFRSIRSSGLYPTLVSYNVILYACVRCGDLATARKLFEEQKASAASNTSLSPNVITYTTMMKGFCSAGLMVDASRLLKDMAEAEVAPNLRTINMFLRGCLWHGNPDEALDCYTRIVKWALSPDRTSVDYTVRVLATGLRLNEACDVLATVPKYITV